MLHYVSFQLLFVFQLGPLWKCALSVSWFQFESRHHLPAWYLTLFIVFYSYNMNWRGNSNLVFILFFRFPINHFQHNGRLEFIFSRKLLCGRGISLGGSELRVHRGCLWLETRLKRVHWEAVVTPAWCELFNHGCPLSFEIQMSATVQMCPVSVSQRKVCGLHQSLWNLCCCRKHAVSERAVSFSTVCSPQKLVYSACY